MITIDTKTARPVDFIQSCRFKRTKKSQWESGLLFNEGNNGIIDRFGTPVKDVWDYKSTPHLAVETPFLSDSQGVPVPKCTCPE